MKVATIDLMRVKAVRSNKTTKKEVDTLRGENMAVKEGIKALESTKIGVQESKEVADKKMMNMVLKQAKNYSMSLPTINLKSLLSPTQEK